MLNMPLSVIKTNTMSVLILIVLHLILSGCLRSICMSEFRDMKEVLICSLMDRIYFTVIIFLAGMKLSYRESWTTVTMIQKLPCQQPTAVIGSHSEEKERLRGSRWMMMSSDRTWRQFNPVP